MKLCIDCKHLSKGLGVICYAPQNGISLLDGKTNPEWATTARSAGLNRCGHDGNFFEPKPVIKKPWWKL
jgi:hypothetical protein